MRVSRGIASVLLASCCALGAAGCAGPRTAAGPERSPGELYARLLGPNAGLTSLRAVVEARLSYAGRRISMPGVLLLDTLGGFRLDLLRRLGLGNEPIRDILALCEVNGCRIVRQTLPEEARIAGIFVFDEERKAAFALVNADEPPGLQTLIAAHLYGHYLMDRADGPIVDNPDVVVDEYVSLYPPREQFAQTFASRFLMPPGKLRELVEKDQRSKSLSFDDVLFLKHYFGVSTRAMLRTLRGRGILAEAKFEEFFKRNPEDREQEVFGSLSGLEERRTRTLFRKSRTIPSDRYRVLAAEAAAMDKARGEHAPPPAPPRPATGETDE